MRLRQELRSAGVADNIRTAYVCGSVGRMECVTSSDCDAAIVLTEEVRASPAAEEIMDTVFECIERTGFGRPKRDGIFGSPTSFEQLLDASTAGQVDEDLAVFGLRIQALLDGQPLLHAGEFESLQRAILGRYASAPRVRSDAFCLDWLMDDLVRYWRSLCARTRWLQHDEPVPWRCLNVKLRHSRLLMCVGLFDLLLHVVDSRSPVDEVARLLRLTPLERILKVSRPRDIEARYEAFVGWMNQGLSSVVESEGAFADCIANGALMSRAIGIELAQSNGARMQAALFGELR